MRIDRGLLTLAVLAALLPAFLPAQNAAKPEELVKQAITLEKEGKWQDARANYLAALEKKPKYAEAAFRLGRLYLSQDSIERATLLLETARDLKYDPFEVSRSLGLAYFKAGKHASAIEQYRLAIERKPKVADVHAGLADVLYANDNMEEAHVEDSIALSIEARSAAAEMIHGRIHARLREYDLARAAYRRALAVDSNCAPAYEALAELSKASQVDTAIAYYRRYLALSPTDANANFSMSGLYYNLSQKDTVRNLPPAPAVVPPADSTALKAYARNRDSLLFALRAAHSESAFVYVDKAIRLGFSRDDVYDFYVKIAQASGKRAASVTALQKALQNNPRDAQKWALLGAVYADSGVMAADTVITKISIDAYKQACVLDSTFRRRCYAWIASQYYKLKNYDSSIVYNTMVIAIDPKAVSAYMNRAYAYAYGKGDWPKAISEVQATINVDPRNTFPRVFLMKYYYGEKKYDAAYNQAKAILEIDSENKDARDVKNNIDVLRAKIKAQEEE